MRSSIAVLAAFVGLSSGLASAASYQDTSGALIDPIQSEITNGPHPYSGPNLTPGVSLNEPDLADSDLRQADLFGANISGGSFSGSNLNNTDLEQSVFNLTDISSAAFRYANLRDAHFTGASLIGADFVGADLGGATFDDSDLFDANFREADLRGADFSGVSRMCSAAPSGYNPFDYASRSHKDATTNFSGLDLRFCSNYYNEVYLGQYGGIYEGSNLSQLSIRFSDDTSMPGSTSGWNFNSADLASARFSSEYINLRDSTAIGAYAPFVDWFINEYDPSSDPPRRSNYTRACIRNMDFTDADLTGSRFGPNSSGCQDLTASDPGYLEFSGNFTRARLPGASFKYVISDFIDFTDAYMPGVDLTGAALRNAIFRGAVLSGSTFDNTDLRDADFSGADLSYTVFLGNIAGSPTYDENTSFSNAYILMACAPFDPDGASWVPFDPAKAGWKAAPEPGFAVGVSAGALAIAAARRRTLGLHRATG